MMPHMKHLKHSLFHVRIVAESLLQIVYKFINVVVDLVMLLSLLVYVFTLLNLSIFIYAKRVI